MAYTKVFAVRNHLARAVSYAANPEKTDEAITLGASVDYALNPDKTEQRLFESAVNCQRPGTAYGEMVATKQRFSKTGGVLAYHFIQSFKPGEVTPEQAHAIGVEFARRCFGERFEAVIGTHLDRHHLHNHVVVNSVSFVDGIKYHSSPESYFHTIRGTSDELCREHGLSVIEPKGRGKHYAEWAAEKAGRPTIRGMIAADIDEIIRQSFTFSTFIEALKKKGYAVKYGPNVKHMAVKPQGGQRFIRLKSLGEEYTEEAIRERLARQRDGQEKKPQAPPSKRCRYTGPPIPTKPKKLKGFMALYFKYLYLLGKVKRRKLPNKAAFLLREDVIRLDRYKEQFLYLYRNGITTTEDLQARRQAIESQIQAATEARKPLYAQRRDAQDEAVMADLSAQISEATARLRELRKEARLCARIEATAPEIREKERQARGAEARQEAEKQVVQAKKKQEPFKMI
ncbi:MAG: relaxase/mobilization nuclease domain-containing protein [Candidatus Pelethousia sp.]|nr:relaxase/mobilization nuclease domain-containing protein [Candidatus Pelethousia sp.]